METNCTQHELQEFISPLTEIDGSTQPDNCKMISRNYSLLTDADICPQHKRNASKTLEATSCDSWEYDQSLYTSTIVTEWDLVCDRAALAVNAAGFYMAARTVGTFVCGWLADR